MLSQKLLTSAPHKSIIMEDEKVQKMARMLEKGGKMLAAHCECSAPLFKYRNEIICAACGRQYEKKGEEYISKAPVVEPKPAESASASASAPAPIPELPAVQNIELAITEKLNQVASDLKGETDLHRIQEQLQCIELGLKILQHLRKSQ